jgi:hypothetical protein
MVGAFGFAEILLTVMWTPPRMATCKAGDDRVLPPALPTSGATSAPSAARA